MRLDQSLTMARNLADPPSDPTLRTISLYLTLSPRPTHRWVRAFRGRLPGTSVDVPPTYELGGHYGGGDYHYYRTSARRAGIRHWLSRLFYRGPTHLIVHECLPTPESVRQALSAARASVRALDAAVAGYDLVRRDSRHDRSRREETLRRALAAADESGSGARRRPVHGAAAPAEPGAG